MKNELSILLRAYALVMVVLLLVFGVWSGVLTAQNNTRKTSFGDKIEMANFDNLI